MIEGESRSIKPGSSQPHLMNDSLTELRVIRTIAEKWGMLTCQPGSPRFVRTACEVKT
jgi:hypothetical protein